MALKITVRHHPLNFPRPGIPGAFFCTRSRDVCHYSQNCLSRRSVSAYRREAGRKQPAGLTRSRIPRKSYFVNHHRGSSPCSSAVCTGAALVRADCTMASWRAPRETSSMSHFLPRGPRGFQATRVPSAIMRRMVMRL